MSSFTSIIKDTKLPLAFILCIFVVSFCTLAAINIDWLSTFVGAGFNFTAQNFGYFWQILVLLNFLISIGICFHPGSKYIIGREKKPIFSDFQWCSMVLCTVLAAGGVFWAAGEPLYHFLNPPPYFGVEGKTVQAIVPALAQSFMHWGFLVWAIVGSLSSIVVMYYHYEKGLPLAPRTMLYPVLGKYVLNGLIGFIVDGACIISVIAGTVGAIGFYGLQVGHGLNLLLDIPDNIWIEAAAIAVLGVIFIASAISGLSRGIQLLSRINVYLALVMLLLLFLLNPIFISKYFILGFVSYIKNFFQMALYHGYPDVVGSADWVNNWTIFFWGWFLGYAPLMAIFIAKVSQGRTIRSLVFMVSIVSPIISCILFGVMGATGISVALGAAEASPIIADFSISSALYHILDGLPLTNVLTALFLLLTTTFVVTTGDSMTFVISSCLSKSENPAPIFRLFFGGCLCVMAVILVYIGENSISMLQSFIILAALPVSFVLIPTMWDSIWIVIKSAEKLKKQE